VRDQERAHVDAERKLEVVYFEGGVSWIMSAHAPSQQDPIP
jgi:hypothetical protein